MDQVVYELETVVRFVAEVMLNMYA